MPEFKIKFHFLHVLSVRKDQGHPCTAAFVHKCVWLTGANIKKPAISPPSAELWLQVLGIANDPFSSKRRVWRKAGSAAEPLRHWAVGPTLPHAAGVVRRHLHFAAIQ